jgi:hypothetical protein
MNSSRARNLGRESCSHRMDNTLDHRGGLSGRGKAGSTPRTHRGELPVRLLKGSSVRGPGPAYLATSVRRSKGTILVPMDCTFPMQVAELGRGDN